MSAWVTLVLLASVPVVDRFPAGVVAFVDAGDVSQGGHPAGCLSCGAVVDWVNGGMWFGDDLPWTTYN